MRQRVISLGGRLDIKSSLGRGTSVEAWIPLRDPDEEPLRAEEAGT
jgi:signal transduction histidine kinase